jgi:hypothetical protein
VEPFNKVWNIKGVFLWLPGFFVIASPTDPILDTAAIASAIEDFFDFIVLLAINNDWRRRRLDLARQGIFRCRFQQGNMEDRVDFHGCRELELVCMGGNFFDDFELSKALEV